MKKPNTKELSTLFDTKSIHSTQNFENMLAFEGIAKLRKVGLACIATQLEDKEIILLKNNFRMWDQNGDGEIDKFEFNNMLKKLKINCKKWKRVFESANNSKSGKIRYSEFLAACMGKEIYMSDTKLTYTFKLLTQNRNDRITAADL